MKPSKQKEVYTHWYSNKIVTNPSKRVVHHHNLTADTFTRHIVVENFEERVFEGKGKEGNITKLFPS